MSEPPNIQRAFVKNRAEELGHDVWAHFAVPPFFDKLDVADARKPRIIIGGRGCGKTMLLRYLSHQSTFSPNRTHVPAEALKHIGLYWRADTQFASAMTGRDIPEDTWESAFHHLVALTLCQEVIGSLDSLLTSHLELDPFAIKNIRFAGMDAFLANPPTDLEGMRVRLNDDLNRLCMWVNNVRTSSPPPFLPGGVFVLHFIKQVTTQVPFLQDSIYFVYLDEYENLSESQQEIINTYLKHSEAPLIFNLAMKRNAFKTHATTGQETIMNIADFRIHNLEEYLADTFDVFAAEILFLTLHVAGLPRAPFDVSLLREPSSLPLRRSSEHRAVVLKAAQALFPDMSQRQLAEMALKDSALATQLRKRVREVLQRRVSSLDPADFYDAAYPEATIVSVALLHRTSLDPAEVLVEFDKLRSGEDNRFTGSTNWIHNNFVGCLLQLYEPHSRTCPFYAGFNTFCGLARGNIRYLLELCHKSITRAAQTGDPLTLQVSTIEQAEAATQASDEFLREVRSCGRLGNHLHVFVLRLGSILALAHSRPTQSEPEPSHFSIREHQARLGPEDREFLREAVKWSVLFEERQTKQKEDLAQVDLESVLNPIYAPFFKITYRKRRRLELSAEDFIKLSRGSYDDLTAILKRLTEQWKVNIDEANETLFAHLKAGGQG